VLDGHQNQDENFDDFLLRNDTNGIGRAGGKKMMQDPLSSSNKDAHENDRYEGLGPVVEEMLLQILISLGVLYLPEHKVLVLPSDSEPFRQAISQRYVAQSGENSLLYWHTLIVRHFLSQPTSLRKCEELPWHLQICRKWNLLRDSLIDLTTFEIMYRNDLKDEMTEYWLLLTEGPLAVSDEEDKQRETNGSAAAAITAAPITATGDDEKDEQEKKFSIILSEIDQALSQKISMKELHKRRREHEVSAIIYLRYILAFIISLCSGATI
jgi:hypothetical protein